MARTGLKYVAKIWRKKLKSYFPRKIPELFLLFTYNSLDNTYYIRQPIEELEVWSAPCPFF